MSEINACFSPDFTDFFYSIILPSREFVILSMSYENNKWSKPEVACFSGKYSDADPFITKDGKWLYFVSKRPEGLAKSEKSDWDIWRVEKIDGHWLNPERLEDGVNSESDDIYPTLCDNGTLYFSSGRDGKNNRDILYSEVSTGYYNQNFKPFTKGIFCRAGFFGNRLEVNQNWLPDSTGVGGRKANLLFSAKRRWWYRWLRNGAE